MSAMCGRFANSETIPVMAGRWAAQVTPGAGGEASLQVTITVSATGTITLCEARILRGVSVGNLGPGWHDRFGKV